MARPLSKRQRKEVQSIVSAAVSPEWKRYQGIIENKSFDQTSAGVGHDLVAEIAAGTGSNDRLGRKIRVKRVEIWGTCVAPPTPTQVPYTGVVSCVYRIKNSSVGAAVVDSLSEFFDPVTADRFTYTSAPTEASEAITFNHKIYRIKRFRMIGATQLANYGYLLASAGIGYPSLAVPTVETKQQTGAGTLGTFSVTAGSLAGNEGSYTHGTVVSASHSVGISNTIEQHDRNIGTSLHFFKHVVKFGGKGLLVGYEDTDFEGSYKQNHIIWNYASSLAPGTLEDHISWCPAMSCAFRVWFTDE